jgi:hypothetical protein
LGNAKNKLNAALIKDDNVQLKAVGISVPQGGAFLSKI